VYHPGVERDTKDLDKGQRVASHLRARGHGHTVTVADDLASMHLANPLQQSCDSCISAFRLASPGKLKDVLGEAGAMAPERLPQFAKQAPISVEDFWTLRCEMTQNFCEKVSTLSRETAIQSIWAFTSVPTILSHRDSA
jgi:hypothetical protein